MRLKILFAIERYLGCDPTRDYTPHYYSTIGSLEELDWADIWVFHIDQSPMCDLVALAESIQPDLVVISYVLSYGDKNVLPGTMDELRRRSKRLVMLWQESSFDVVRTADQFNSLVDFHVVIDSLTRYQKYTVHPEKYLAVYDPRSPAVFHALGTEQRHTKLGFAGTLINRPERIFYCANLWLNGLPLAKFAGQGELLVPLPTYVSFLKYSRIQLNFSDSGPNERHYKGRVAEVTLCGAMLLELENPETNNIFEPMKEYVPFNSMEDLIQKVRYYIANPEEAQQIADAGRKVAERQLTGRVFWKAVFERAGLEIAS